MVKCILIIFLLIFSVLGVCEQIYIIKMLFYYPGKRIKNYTVIILENKYAVKQLNFLYKKICWYGNEFANGIIAVTDFLDIDEIIKCKEFIFNKNIVLCDLKSLYKCQYLQGEL